MKLYTILASMLLVGTALTTHAQCDTVDLALGHGAVASTIETVSFPATMAVDADTTGSRWSSTYADDNWMYVDLGAKFNLCQVKLYWEVALGKDFDIDISDDAVNWTTASTIRGNTSYVNTIGISASARYVRMWGIARGTGWGYSLYAFKVYGSPGYTGSANQQLGKTASATSAQIGHGASSAIDASSSTYWLSNIGNGQNLTIDFGSVYTIGTIGLLMTGNYATSFEIDFSNDNTNWTSAVNVVNNSAQKIAVNAAGTARYVRFAGQGSFLGLGYGIQNLSISGFAGTLPVSFTDFRATKIAGDRVRLQWEVATPAGEGVFHVERSVKGGPFADVGTVPVETNNGVYAWTDSFPGAGLNSYRIQEVDLAGPTVYTEIAAVNPDEINVGVLGVYPNPAKDYVVISNPGHAVITRIDIYTLDGARRRSLEEETTGDVRVGLAGLPAGVYFVSVTAGNEGRTLRVVKY